ncbi:TonB-dependent receptor [Acidithiobacillus ferrianus]|uniref:TonB-dependent receptor n=1 Tax=Acidithiobacillus ferrianus TaxID=2678518 RepID=UPI0034E401AB
MIMKIIPIAVSLICVQDSYAEGAITAATQSTNKLEQGKKNIVTTIASINKAAPPEKAVTSVNNVSSSSASPNGSIQSILRKVPGMNVLSSGPGNLSTATSSQFTFQGFKSSQIAQNYDGVPITNPFDGGTGGTNNNHAYTPLTLGQISGVKVYSGANTPSQNGINSLGGTIDYLSKKPTNKFYAEISTEGGKYSGLGGSTTESATINSGVLPLAGTKIIASYSYTDAPSFMRNVYARINSYYLSAVQPYNNGLSQFSFVAAYNNENARMPYQVPIPLLNKYGNNFQWPSSVTYGNVHSHALTLIAGWKSIWNRYLTGATKVYYEQQDNNRTSYANEAYASAQYPGYLIYDGYPVRNVIEGFDTPSSVNSYDPVAQFGSAYAGSQYHNYVDNITILGAMPSIGIFLPHNYVKIGGNLMRSTYSIYENWYGNYNVPNIIGYNDAFHELATRDFYSAYAEDNISLLENKLHIYPGIKATIVDTNLTAQTGYYYQHGGENGNSYTFLEPSLGVSYSPLNPVNIYFSVGQSFKAPNISAYYSGIGSSPIPSAIITQPEQVISYNMGARYKSPIGGLTVSYFRRNFSKIFSDFYNGETGQTFVYNNGTALYQGVTLGLSIPINQSVSLNGSYSYTSAKYTSLSVGANGTTYPGQSRPYVPQYTATAGVSYKSNGFNISLFGDFVGRQYVENSSGQTIGDTIPAYQTLNISAGYMLKLQNNFAKRVDISAYVDNLTNNQYLAYEQEYLSPFTYMRGTVGDPIYVGARVAIKF